MAKRFKQHPENCECKLWCHQLSYIYFLGLEWKKHHFLEDGNRNPYKRRGETSSNLIFFRENPAGKYKDFIVLFHIVRFIEFIISFWLDIVYTIIFNVVLQTDPPEHTHTHKIISQYIGKSYTATFFPDNFPLFFWTWSRSPSCQNGHLAIRDLESTTEI